MRRPRVFPLEEILLAQLFPGFLFVMGWTALYEIYHEDGSYFTTLIQEILGTEGMLPDFIILAVLMSFPVGMIVDAIRHVVAEVWLGLPRMAPKGRRPPSFSEWLVRVGAPGEETQRRFDLYRRAQATILIPARAAGNLGLVVLILGVWATVKIFRMGGLQTFSMAFVMGTPLAGLGLVLVLWIRYATGLREFSRDVSGVVPPVKEPAPAPLAGGEAVFESAPPAIPATARPPEGL